MEDARRVFNKMAIQDMVSWTAMIFGHVKYGQGQQAAELIQQGVCHTVALPFYSKKYLKAKEELWKLKYFTMQKYNLQNIL
jgi:hypothetical protein